jgi:hypothetical protein
MSAFGQDSNKKTTALANPKSQNPNPNQIPRAKSQGAREIRLGVGNWELCGVWVLVIGFFLRRE